MRKNLEGYFCRKVFVKEDGRYISKYEVSHHGKVIGLFDTLSKANVAYEEYIHGGNKRKYIDTEIYSKPD